ncbi:hypothetical protein QWY16_03935 [Planococcus shenhongbingii]|uniref:hypothetical protein n=1 Tax=Planococcus shenhongbingii TaxID=3058398 RepID=UPI002624C0A6|nr:hypothetical protein [Planococcus sp. N016]WKA59314.1 hypothetical protein QWY16_03935 [Planococcus sp. N016]
METTARDDMMKRMDFFIGNWNMEVIHPHIQPSPISGQTNFRWLDEKYVIQRTHINKSEFPDNTIIYDCNPDTGQYLMHYFDSRGVTRLYSMNLENGVWKWWRNTADFSPLKFQQRFTGEVDDTGKTIRSLLEKSDDGVNWERDFEVVYRKD